MGLWDAFKDAMKEATAQTLLSIKMKTDLWAALTPQERKVLRAAIRGESVELTAFKEGMPEYHVNVYRESAYRKASQAFGCNYTCIEDLAEVCIRNGWFVD